jgi:glycosyltransferase involved in cell wall biosynthesis
MRIAIHGRYRFESSNGVDRTIAGLAQSFSAERHEVTIITTEHTNSLNLEKTQSLGIKLVYCGSSLRDLLRFQIDWKEFDLVIFNSVFIWQSIFLSRNCKIPYLCIPNGGYFQGSINNRSFWKKKIFIHLFERLHLERATAVQALSNAESNSIKAIAPRARVIQAPNGVFPVERAHAYNPSSGGTRTATFIGRMSIQHKGLDLLLVGLQVARNHGCDINLNLVGPFDQKEKLELTRLIEQLDLSSFVKLHGGLYGTEKNAILSKSDFFIHTSRWEGMPFSVIEAMQFGIPVIVSKETNLAEIVANSNAGWVLPENNSQLIGEVLRLAYRASRDELIAKGKNASFAVTENLDWIKISRSILSQLQQHIIIDE